MKTFFYGALLLSHNVPKFEKKFMETIILYNPKIEF